jgi:hypothetical protein
MTSFMQYGRSFGLGGFIGGGLAGILFLLYPNVFPQHSTLQGVMLIGASLGAASQRLANALIFRALRFYLNLAQLIVLRPYIGDRTTNEIAQRLTRRYFLGDENPPAQVPSPQDKK